MVCIKINKFDRDQPGSYRDTRGENGDLAIPVNKTHLCASRLSWLLTHNRES